MSKRIIMLSFLLVSTFPFVLCRNYKMIVGTYTQGTQSEGIYALEFNKKGALVSKKLLAKSLNPSFLAFSPDEKYVYAVNETGQKSTVSAFAFDKKAGTLTFLSKSDVLEGPCHVYSAQNHVFTANYTSGSISILGRKENGALTDTLYNIIHPRYLYGPGRTGPSHAHQIVSSPDGRFVLATNLGTDGVFAYRYHPASTKNVLEFISETKVAKRSGPRHMTFSKNGKFLYLLNELSAELNVFSVDSACNLTRIQEIPLVDDISKTKSGADIHLSPDGKYLYATNRADENTITCFKVYKNGTIKRVEQYSTYGNAPRNFAISPDGKFVFVGNQKTNNITVFSRNKRNGKLKLIGKDIELGAPVCLLFYK
ncbi:MAG: lactonase family protein [Bacteroidales bacterium]|nr:lactonase family protein [Bacteroidales bacterium]